MKKIQVPLGWETPQLATVTTTTMPLGKTRLRFRLDNTDDIDLCPLCINCQIHMPRRLCRSLVGNRACACIAQGSSIQRGLHATDAVLRTTPNDCDNDHGKSDQSHCPSYVSEKCTQKCRRGDPGLKDARGRELPAPSGSRCTLTCTCLSRQMLDHDCCHSLDLVGAFMSGTGPDCIHPSTINSAHRLSLTSTEIMRTTASRHSRLKHRLFPRSSMNGHGPRMDWKR